MDINCKKCGKRISVSDGLLDGQNVRCPFCGEKFAYSRPADITEDGLRLALETSLRDPDKKRYYQNAPAGARLYIALVFYGEVFRETLDQDAYVAAFREIGAELKESDLRYLLQHEDDAAMREYLSDRLAAIGGSAGDPDEAAVRAPSQPHAKLAVIRPHVASDGHPDASVPSQKETDRIRKPRSASILNKEHPIYYSLAILVAGVTIAAIFMLNHRQRSETLRRERLARESELERQEELEKQRSERLAQERQWQDERRREAEQRAAEEAADAKRRQDELNARRQAEEERRARLAVREEILAQIGQVDYDYWRNCPKEDRPQSVAERREYTCLVPAGSDDAVEIMKIVATPGTNMAVEICADDGTYSPMDQKAFDETLKRGPYLILSGGRGWICGVKRDNDGVPVVDNGSSINPAEEELGALYGLLRSRSAKTDDLAYNVYFSHKGRRGLVRRVRFGEIVSAGDVKPLIREDLQERADAKRSRRSAKQKKFKRTVVFGAVPNIRRQINGPIVIPYAMPAYSGMGVDYSSGYYDRDGFHQTWSRTSSNASGTREREYLNLRAIAEKEDREEAAWKNEQYARRLRESHFEVSESEVEKVLFAGKFTFSSDR